MLILESKLKEYPVVEKEVLKILTQVNVTRRQCEIVSLRFLRWLFWEGCQSGQDVYIFFVVSAETGVDGFR